MQNRNEEAGIDYVFVFLVSGTTMGLKELAQESIVRLQRQYSIMSSASLISQQQSSADYSEVKQGREGCGVGQQRAAHSNGRGKEAIWVNYGNSTMTRHDRVEAQWKTAE